MFPPKNVAYKELSITIPRDFGRFERRHLVNSGITANQIMNISKQF